MPTMKDIKANESVIKRNSNKFFSPDNNEDDNDDVSLKKVIHKNGNFAKSVLKVKRNSLFFKMNSNRDTKEF